MKLKLDENLDPRATAILALEGRKVMTVQEEGLRGAPDTRLAEAAREERACLVTFDLGFADILAFPPHEYNGIVVLRHPKPSVRGLLGLVEELGRILRTQDPTGKLWIVQPGRLRVHEPIEHEEGA